MRQYGQLDPLEAHLKERLSDFRGERNAQWRALQHIRGHLHWRNGTLKDARKAFQALAKESDDIDARLNLAKLWDSEGKLKQAEETYRELLPEVRFQFLQMEEDK